MGPTWAPVMWQKAASATLHRPDPAWVINALSTAALGVSQLERGSWESWNKGEGVWDKVSPMPPKSLSPFTPKISLC